jgi:hypothetical protein
MTFEELEQALKDLNSVLAELAEREDTLSTKEWRQQQWLLREKQYLEKIKQAKEARNTIQEIKLLAEYSALKEASTRHPIINYLIQLKTRSNIWG